MNINSIAALFTLFSGEQNVKKYFPLINSAMNNVRKYLKPDADSSDERLCFLCAAIANLNHSRILAARDSINYSLSGESARISDSSSGYLGFAHSLVREYLASASDLLSDADFSFFSV